MRQKHCVPERERAIIALTALETAQTEATGRPCMENKLIRSKYFLYLTEFFSGMSVMSVELGVPAGLLRRSRS